MSMSYGCTWRVFCTSFWQVLLQQVGLSKGLLLSQESYRAFSRAAPRISNARKTMAEPASCFFNAASTRLSASTTRRIFPAGAAFQKARLPNSRESMAC